MSACPNCGEKIPAKARKARKTPARIGLTGRVPAEQRKWYEESMRVKRGELVWSTLANWDRFGARGDYVTLEKAAELEAKAASGALDPYLTSADRDRREVAVLKSLAPNREKVAA
jgi:hypothetical protein